MRSLSTALRRHTTTHDQLGKTFLVRESIAGIRSLGTRAFTKNWPDIIKRKVKLPSASILSLTTALSFHASFFFQLAFHLVLT